MKEVQTSGEYKIYEKRSGRYAVKDKSKKLVNGDEKAKILADAGLVTIPVAKPKPAEQEAVAEESASDESTSEETPAEEAADAE